MRDARSATETAFKRWGVALVAGFLGWRILVNGLSDHYVSQETLEAAEGALRWRGDQPMALYRQAMALDASQAEEAERLLRAAAWANPTDALVYLALAARWAGTERRAVAVGLGEIADTLGPLRSPALVRSAEFWVGQGRLDRALARWSMLLQTRPETASHLFPLLLRMAEDPATRRLLQPWLSHPPEWWDRFFVHAALKARQPETVIFLYQSRDRHGVLPGVEEQRAYLDRLWKEKRWLDVYLAWLNGLDDRQTQMLGNIHNGSFEEPVTDLGFDWRLSPPRGATVEVLETYGARGNKALHVSFNGERVRFQDVLQYLMLDAGRYRLQGRVRPDGLKAERGLRWRLRCIGANVLLAESEPVVGSDEWRTFVVDFAVPEQGCPAQSLRLELDGRVELDFQARGDVWFDDLAITRLE